VLSAGVIALLLVTCPKVIGTEPQSAQDQPAAPLPHGVLRQIRTPGPVDTIVFDPDGRGFTTRVGDETLRWDLATGKLLGRVRESARNDTLREAAFPGGKLLARLDPRRPAWIGLVEKGAKEPRFELMGEGKAFCCVAVAPDGKFVVAGGKEKSVYWWEVTTRQKAFELHGHDGFVTGVAFSPDGRTLVTGGADATVLVWDVCTAGSPLAPATRRPDDAQLNQLWETLRGGHGAAAYRAVRILTAAPERSLPFLKKHAPPRLDLRHIQRLIADLDNEEFEVRQAATGALTRLGRGVEAPLRQALEGRPTLEVRRRIERLLDGMDKEDELAAHRWGRAVVVLERVGSREARDVLDDLVHGCVGERVVADARAALARLKQAAG
jgi:hypothetical protein